MLITDWRQHAFAGLARPSSLIAAVAAPSLNHIKKVIRWHTMT
jgi:hypothetical protein